MRAYSIFDDYSDEAIAILKNSGVVVTVHPHGVPRPDHDQMKTILEKYDCVIIGTSQKITEDMFEGIISPRIIATASIGVDHISIPHSKTDLVEVINTPGANTQSVAEYNVGAMLMARKRLMEGSDLYTNGLDNKKLIRKPEDIKNTTIGFVGAGRISTRTMELLQPFGVSFLCYSDDADQKQNLVNTLGVRFVSLKELAEKSDIISVNVPSTAGTANLINLEVISAMKEDCIFVSIAREQVIDLKALFKKADHCPNFYAMLDLDVNTDFVKRSNRRNIVITPHIAGGTIESRLRMFREVAEKIASSVQNREGK